MNQAMDWVKSNLLIVIFAIVIFAALIALPIVARGMNQSVQAAMSQRKDLEVDLNRLSTTGIDLVDPTPWFTPPPAETALVNPAALEATREYAATREEEAKRLVAEAVAHNSKDRTVLIPQLLPSVGIDRKQILTRDMSVKLNEAYEQLLRDINAGSPPALESMKDALIRLRNQFITRVLAQEGREELNEEDERNLAREMGERRLSEANAVAQNIGIYASMDVMDAPSWDFGQTPEPDMIELFTWQWDYWTIEDILRAIGDANQGSTSVHNSAVKRVKSIEIIDGEGAEDRKDGREDNRRGRPANPGGGNQGAGGPFLSGGGMGQGNDPPPPTGGGANSGGGNEAAAPAGQPFNPANEVKRDFSATFTGRADNPLYDVRTVRVHLVVDTARVPEVLDAIGKRNFMTVTGLELWPADAYADLEAGYVYGPAPTSEVVLDLETIWLREWTTPFMPAEMKVALGIPTGAANETPASQ